MKAILEAIQAGTIENVLPEIVCLKSRLTWRALKLQRNSVFQQSFSKIMN